MTGTTGRLGLPYIQQSQSQKEVTHNNALNILDVLIQAVVQDIGLNTPPSSAAAGQCWIVGTSPTGAWVGNSNAVAQADGAGGWFLVAPFKRMRLWVESLDLDYYFDGSAWQPWGLLMKDTGEYLRVEQLQQDITVSGSSVTSSIQIPNRALVIAANAHVITAITGTTSFSVGVTDDTGRYGTDIGASLDSTNIGVSYNPIAYYAATSLQLTPAGGSFTGGIVRTSIQFLLPKGPWTF